MDNAMTDSIMGTASPAASAATAAFAVNIDGRHLQSRRPSSPEATPRPAATKRMAWASPFARSLPSVLPLASCAGTSDNAACMMGSPSEIRGLQMEYVIWWAARLMAPKALPILVSKLISTTCMTWKDMKGAAKTISGSIRAGRKDCSQAAGLDNRGGAPAAPAECLPAAWKPWLLRSARASKAIATNCPETVAVAAPTVPRPRPAMRTRSRTRLTRPPAAVARSGVTVSCRALKHAADNTSCSICTGKARARMPM
mmetsp:Transcript_47875/g.138468  ORF Transcript_47875/g.138468 Transcript_47875/m.138468 type:complete len:256 (+) Transcript_47875:461-1228(+)